MRPLLLIFTWVAFASFASAQSQVPWVRMGSDGRLIYKFDAQGNHIPDFSNCGYGGGGVPIPDVPVKATVEPGMGDAGARIQAAIDAVSELPAAADGFRGAVLLKKGRYPVAGQIRIVASGVVLRGEGQDSDGTVIVATGTGQRSLIVIGDNKGLPAIPGLTNSIDPAITDEYVPVGARRFHVDDASGLKVGDEVIVTRPSTAEWIHTIGMDRIPQNAEHSVVQWQPGSKDLVFNRVITAVAGKEVTVDAPLCNAFEKKFGGGQVIVCPPYRGLNQIGVENLRGDSEFKNPQDENHGWIFIDLIEARNVWVRKVTTIHFGYGCVFVRHSCKWITIEDCGCLDPVSIITGKRRYSFALDGQLTLVQRCGTRGGRHDFVMHAQAAGPNVFLDCVAESSYSDSGPHHRWSAGVLYDNVTVKPGFLDGRFDAGEINLRNRGNYGTGHGWAGANQVLWNCSAAGIICQQPPTAQNWAIGCVASSHSGNGYWESFGQPVQPRSLYLAQLRERLAAAVSTK